MTQKSVIEQNKKNYAISLSRVLGMVFIVLCHIVRYYSFIPGHSILGQFFNCAVYLFIFVSGYLYGTKNISDFKNWFAKRWIVVSMPAITLSVGVIAVLLFIGETVSVNSAIAYCIDAEGLLFISGNIFGNLFDAIPSIDMLWFTTVIMMCYFMIPLLQKISQRINANFFRCFIIISVLIGFVVSLLLDKYISLEYFVLFAFGYYLGRIKWLDSINLQIFSICTVVVVILLISRVVLQRYYDNTFIYLQFAAWSHQFVGVWFVIAFSFLSKKYYALVQKIAESYIVKLMDKYSYYVYISHGIFCMGTFNVYEKMSSLFFATAVFVVGTLVLSLMLKKTTDFLSNLMMKK